MSDRADEIATVLLQEFCASLRARGYALPPTSDESAWEDDCAAAAKHVEALEAENAKAIIYRGSGDDLATDCIAKLQESGRAETDRFLARFGYAASEETHALRAALEAVDHHEDCEYNDDGTFSCVHGCPVDGHTARLEEDNEHLRAAAKRAKDVDLFKAIADGARLTGHIKRLSIYAIRTMAYVVRQRLDEAILDGDAALTATRPAEGEPVYHAIVAATEAAMVQCSKPPSNAPPEDPDARQEEDPISDLRDTMANARRASEREPCPGCRNGISIHDGIEVCAACDGSGFLPAPTEGE